MEGDETAAGAAVRELKEEVGVIADEESLAFAHVMHRVHKTNGGREYIDFYLATKKWDHAPHNAEPEKCDDAKWFPLDALPENTISSVRTAIQNYQNGITFSEFGWDGQL
jgi:ADP-ribose pyrophosphatase YjhB (NUDIX family)